MDLRAPRTALLCSALLLLALADPAGAKVKLPLGSYTFALDAAVPSITAPPRWDPCTVIPWSIDLTRAPGGMLAQSREAIRRVSAATGLRFRYVKTRPALSITFSATSMGDELGVGSWHGYAVGQQWKITTGSVVLDPVRMAALPRGFGRGPDVGQVLLHELGHAVGLGHSTDLRNVMYPHPTHDIATWGPGDLAGLRLVGATQGCIGS